MQFNPTSNVTLFLSVRKGLESCILNEIKHNKLLNNFYKIHKNKFQNSQDSYTHPITKPNNDNSSITENADSYNRAIRLENTPNSVQLSEEFEDTNKWLRIYNNNKPTDSSEEKTPKLINTVSVKSNNPRDYLDINLQKGGLEIKCNFEWLIKSSLLIKSAESIWLRIGNPFRCHTQDQLTSFISKFPWFNYFSSPDSVDKVPLRIISRNSKLWSSHIVRDCVTKGIKQSLNSELKLGNNHRTENSDNLDKAGCIQDSCISVTINRNTCYTAIQFSGRLSPRSYNYLDKFNNTNTEDIATNRIEDIVRDTRKDYYNHIPLWSLSGVRKAISKSFNTHYSTNLVENSLESYDSKRTNYIKFQNLLTNDFVDTSDSLVAAFLHNKRLLKTIDSYSTTQTIWDPFCGTGLVICELISLILSLPNYTLENTNTITSSAKTFFTQNATQIKSLFDQYNNLGQKTKTFNIVGSDTNLVKLTEANSKILKFISYYKDILDSSKLEAKNSIYSKNSTLYRSYSKLPLTIHNCSPEKLSHYMTNATIVTKFPYLDSKDKRKFETIKLCKLFGQVISSNSDWKGVFVISRGNFFEYHSGLEWKTIVKSINSNSEIKLLEWTGRTRNFKSVQDKIDQLNEIDFI